MVEQHNANVATVVGIDDAGTDIDAVLDGQPGTGGHAAVAIVRHGDGQIGGANAFAARRNGHVVGTVLEEEGMEDNELEYRHRFDDECSGLVPSQITAGGQCGAARRSESMLRQFGETQHAGRRGR